MLESGNSMLIDWKISIEKNMVGRLTPSWGRDADIWKSIIIGQGQVIGIVLLVKGRKKATILSQDSGFFLS